MLKRYYTTKPYPHVNIGSVCQTKSQPSITHAPSPFSPIGDPAADPWCSSNPTQGVPLSLSVPKTDISCRSASPHCLSVFSSILPCRHRPHSLANATTVSYRYEPNTAAPAAGSPPSCTVAWSCGYSALHLSTEQLEPRSRLAGASCLLEEIMYGLMGPGRSSTCVLDRIASIASCIAVSKGPTWNLGYCRQNRWEERSGGTCAVTEGGALTVTGADEGREAMQVPGRKECFTPPWEGSQRKSQNLLRHV